jgi:hypothetical protein
MNCSFYDLPCWLAWVVEELRLFFIWCLEGVFNGIYSALNSIPVPDFLQQPAAIQIPDSVSYFADVFALPEGVGMIVSAYTLRFILRRVPGIG